jgi:hypothetical protein
MMNPGRIVWCYLFLPVLFLEVSFISYAQTGKKPGDWQSLKPGTTNQLKKRATRSYSGATPFVMVNGKLTDSKTGSGLAFSI